MTIPSAPFEFPSGFHIVAAPIELRLPGRSMMYHGVDRAPFLVPPDAPIREYFGIPMPTSSAEQVALERYFAVLDQMPFGIDSFDSAENLLCDLSQFCQSLEMIFVVAAKANVPYQDLAPADWPAKRFKFLGYDVSWPGMNHSAIRQPGVMDANRDWPPRLNEYGLLADVDHAARLSDEYLAQYPHPPFVILGVYGPS
jgi:hypothetical protein